MSNYRYEGYGVVRDLKDDIPYHTDDIVDLLEEKDQQIAELQKQLKSQPAEIVKKIVGDIKENFDWRQCCEIRKYYDQQYIWFNYVTFNDFLDTILKEYGGEDE